MITDLCVESFFRIHPSIQRKMGLFGGLLFSMFVHMLVVPFLQVMFVAGIGALILALGIFLLQYFTVLQIVLVLIGVVVFIVTLKWCCHETEDDEEEVEVDDEHRSVLYTNPFVRKRVVY